MWRVKLKYRKGAEVKFISHRDLMRAFTRALRRAQIPMTFSQGFNPHMKISWGNALKVGVASEAEFCEIQISGHCPPSQIKERLNQVLPKGLEILEAYLV
jgi:radical SAM-linked protein